MALPSDSNAVAAPKRSLEHWAILGGTLIAALAVLVIGLWIQPDPRGFGTHEQLGMTPCNFLAWTSIPCPGCGVTTSVALAARGRFAQAFWNQPLGLVVTLIVPIAAVVVVVQHARGRDLGDTFRALRPGWCAIALGVVALIGWIWKIVAMRAA